MTHPRGTPLGRPRGPARLNRLRAAQAGYDVGVVWGVLTAVRALELRTARLDARERDLEDRERRFAELAAAAHDLIPTQRTTSPDEASTSVRSTRS